MLKKNDIIHKIPQSKKWKHLVKSVFMYFVSISARLKVLSCRKLRPGPLLVFNYSEANMLPSLSQRGNDPTQRGSAARWPVAVCSEVGTVCPHGGGCVCVWEREASTFAGPPLVLLHHCFSSLGAGNSCGEWGKSLQRAAVWGLQCTARQYQSKLHETSASAETNHIMLAHSHRHGLQLAITHPGLYVEGNLMIHS